MGTTPLGLPFPEPTDQPYVHLDLKALADAIDAKLPRSGEVLLEGVGSSTTATVPFGQPVPGPPVAVHATVSSGSSKTPAVTVRTDTYTADGFRVLLSGMSTAPDNVRVVWTATF